MAGDGVRVWWRTEGLIRYAVRPCQVKNWAERTEDEQSWREKITSEPKGQYDVEDVKRRHTDRHTRPGTARRERKDCGQAIVPYMGG